MAFDIYAPNFLTGLKDTSQDEKPDASTRTTGEAVVDTLSKVAEPLFGMVRAGTTAAREVFPQSEWAKAADEDAKRWQHNLQEHLTPYQKAVDTSRWFPDYGERSATANPVSKIISDVAGFAVPAAVGAATGGAGAAVGLTGPALATTAALGTGAVFGAQGTGETLAHQYDYAMDTPLDELKKSPVFNKAWVEFNGDEKAARQKFYDDTKDIQAAFIAGGAQGLTYGAIARLFPPARQEAVSLIGRLLQGRTGNAAYRGVQGLTESAVAAPIMGGTGTYAQQSQLVNAGLQPNVDPHAMATGTVDTFTSMAPFITGSHIFRGRHTPLDSDIKKVAGTALQTDTPPAVGETGAPGSPGGFEPTTPQTFPPPPDGTRGPPAPIPGAWPDVGPPGTGPGSPPGPAGGPPPSTPPPGGGPSTPAAAAPTPPVGPPPAGPPPIAPAPPAAAAAAPPVRPPSDSGATIPPPPSSGVAAPTGPAPAPATPAAPARPVPSPVARTEPAAGPPPETRRAWAERILQTETDPVRRKWLEDLIRQETPVSPEAPPEAPPRQTVSDQLKERAAQQREGVPEVPPEAAPVNRSFEQFHSANLVSERLQQDGKLFITQEADGTFTAHEGRLQAKLELNPTADERKAARVAQADVELADTPQERAVAAEQVKEALRPAVERAVAEQLTPQGGGEAPAPYATNTLGAQQAPSGVTRQREKPSVPAPETIPATRAAATPEVKEFPNVARERARAPAPAEPGTLGEALSPDQQQHMQRIRDAAEAAQTEPQRAAAQAERDRQAGAGPVTGVATKLGPRTGAKTEPRVRTGRYKTGLERALEASITAFKAAPQKTVEAWTGLRRRALQVEAARVDAGLKAKGYLSQIGERPDDGTEFYPYQKGFQREVPRGQEREATPREQALTNRIVAMHQDVRDNRIGNLAVFRARRNSLLQEARRVDADRHAEGLDPVFERALPKEPRLLGPRFVEAQEGAPAHRRISPAEEFNEQAAVLNLHRGMSADKFAKSTAVRLATERMAALNETLRLAGQEQLPIPIWVREKFIQYDPGSAVAKLLIENKPYVQASQRAFARRQGQVLARAPTISRVETMKRQAESESTTGTQKHDVGTISGTTEPYSPVSTAEFERRQEKLRQAKAVGTPVGDYLRALAEREQRKLTKEELRQVAHETLERERAAGKKRQYIENLPDEAALNRIADEVHGEANRIEKISDATGSTREKHTAMRDQAIKDVVDAVLKDHYGEPSPDALRAGLEDLVDRLQIGAPPTPPDIPEKSQSQIRREKKAAMRAGKPAMPRELVARTRRGSALTGAALNKDVVKKLMETVPGLDVEERKRTGAGESHQKIREEYEQAVRHWQDRVLNQIVAGYETKPIIDNIIHLAKLYTERVKEKNDIKGKSIATWIPNGTRQKTTDGHDYTKYTAGHAEAKAEHFNMLADLMNASEQLRLAQIYAPEVKHFDTLKPADAQQIVTRLVPLLTKLGGDLRAYERGKIAILNEARKAKTADITEAKKGISRDQAKPEAEGEDAGEMAAARGEQAELAPSAEEQMIAREEATEPTESGVPETEYQRRVREKKVNRDWQNLISNQASATQARFGRVLGTTAPGAYAKIEQTEDRPPSKGRKLEGEELAKRIAELQGNRRNRPADGPPPETAEEYRHEVRAARDALASDTPEHAMIGDAEPASTSLDRAKAILARGEAADVSSFITPEFLDKLSKINDGVQVLHAPVEVVRGENNEGQAFYQPNHDRIVLSNNVSSGDYVKNVAHEHVHAATENLLHTDAAFRSEVDDLRATAQRAAARQGVTNERLLYGLRDPHEFLSEASSNPEFRALLGRAAAPGKAVIHGAKTVLNALYRTVREAWRRLVGNKDADTALDVLFRDTSSVLGRTDRLIAKTLDRLELEGRQPSSEGERRYAPSAREVLEGGANKARDFWGNLAQSRFDLGMSLQTTMDLTHRGVKDFRDRALAVAKVAARTVTMRGEIITKEDQPKLLKVSQWFNALDRATRRKVQRFLLDETSHNAFAHVRLNDPLNKHVSLDDLYNKLGPKRASLRDAQVHRMHNEMMKRYNELRSVAGFEENRTALHKFYADRENEIRDAVSRQLIEHLGVIDPTKTPSQKAADINLLQKYLFKGGLSAAEKTQLEAIKSAAGRKVFRDLVNRIRRTPELTKIAGPYIPLTRRGNWAVFGRFKMPEGGANGERPVGVKDSNGNEIDDGTRMFDTREEAEAFEKRMHDKFGVTQLDGGEWFIDKATGKRAREYTEEELHAMQEQDPDLRNRLLKAVEIPGRTIDFEGGQYEKKYWVKLQPKLLEFHNSKSVANASAAAWRTLHGADIEVTNAEPVHRGAGKENEKYASAQMQKLIDRIEQSESYRALNDDQKAALKSALTLQAAKLSLRRGVRQSFKAREYVAGVDPEHLMSNAADYSGQTAGYIANVRHYTEMAEAKAELDKFMHETRYSQDKVSLIHVRARDELYRKITQPAESPVATPFAKGVDFVLKWSLFNRLAGISYYVINGTEPINLGAPMMMDRHGVGTGRSVVMELNRSYRLINPFKMTWYGVRDAGKALAGRAEKFDANGNPTVYTDYATLFKEAIARQTDRAGLEDFLKQAGKLGLFESSANVEYQRLLQGPSVDTGRLDKAADWATNVFQGANTAVENLNRFVTGITAYRLEMKRTGDHQAAVDYATDIMYRTNGDYREWNTPSLFGKSPLTKLAFQYHKYPQRVYVGYVEGAVASLDALKQLRRGEEVSPENKEKIRRLMGMMAMQVGFAGVLGLPTEILKAPLNAAYLVGLSNVTGNDAENEFRAWVQGPEGSMIGQVLSDGFSRLTPVDISGKMSVNFGPYGSPQSRKPADVMASVFRVFLGSGGQLSEETREGWVYAFQGWQQISEGATTQGWETMKKGLRLLAPVRAAADLLVATNGGQPTKTAAGKTISPELTGSQQVVRALGFQPTDVVLRRESRERVKGKADRYTAERSRLTNEWVQASPAEQAEIKRSIDQFNARFTDPKQRIQVSDLLKAKAAYAKAQKIPASEMGLPLTARTRPFLQTEPNYGAAR